MQHVVFLHTFLEKNILSVRSKKQFLRPQKKDKKMKKDAPEIKLMYKDAVLKIFTKATRQEHVGQQPKIVKVRSHGMAHQAPVTIVIYKLWRNT